MSSVVAFRNKAKNSPLILVDETSWKNIVVEELKRKLRSGVKIYQISEKTGLCFATISKIICEDTRFPRMLTMMKLMKYLKFKVFIQTA